MHKRILSNRPTRQTASKLCHLAAWRRGCIKGWDARRTEKMKPQQPVGCEDFIKPSNAADRLKIMPPGSLETGMHKRMGCKADGEDKTAATCRL